MESRTENWGTLLYSPHYCPLNKGTLESGFHIIIHAEAFSTAETLNFYERFKNQNSFNT